MNHYVHCCILNSYEPKPLGGPRYVLLNKTFLQFTSVSWYDLHDVASESSYGCPGRDRNIWLSGLVVNSIVRHLALFFLLVKGFFADFTRLALQLLIVKGFMLFSFQKQNPLGSVLLFFVTTSLCQDWVICVPAAFLGCGGHFSGPLSGIEP